jgi:hypothetical protein
MIDEKTRAIATYYPFTTGTDEFAKEQGIALETIRCARGIRHFTAETKYSNGIQSIIGDSLYSGLFDETGNNIQAYLNASKCPSILYELKGYSQGEWSEVVAYPLNESDEIDEVQLKEIMENQIDPYYKGEVYLVRIQRAKVYTADDGSTYTEWLNDTNEQMIEVVQEFFEITREFVDSHYNLTSN